MPGVNALGQPVGDPVSGWSPRPFPPLAAMTGRHVRLEPLAMVHARALFEADRTAADDSDWTYLSQEPPRSEDDYHRWCATAAASRDPQFFAIIDGRSGAAVGRIAYLRIDPQNGAIEIGHVKFSPSLQRTPAATEAVFLMMTRAFDELGYRRLEWKCDALNARSHAAAQRLGFRLEGVFRQAVVVKGRNRDTAWFSIIDKEWPALRGAFAAWLAPDNFTGDGEQKTRLADLIEAARRA